MSKLTNNKRSFINGEYFSVNQSIELAFFESGHGDEYYFEKLYKVVSTRKKRKHYYFLLCYGKPKSKYATPPFNGIENDTIIPMNEEAATRWATTHNIKIIDKMKMKIFTTSILINEKLYDEFKNSKIKIDDVINEFSLLEKNKRKEFYEKKYIDYLSDKKKKVSIKFNEKSVDFINSEIKENKIFKIDVISNAIIFFLLKS